MIASISMSLLIELKEKPISVIGFLACKCTGTGDNWKILAEGAANDWADRQISHHSSFIGRAYHQMLGNKVQRLSLMLTTTRHSSCRSSSAVMYDVDFPTAS